MKHGDKFMTVRLPVEMRKSDLFWLVATAFYSPRHQRWVKGGELHPTLDELYWEGRGGDDARWLEAQGEDAELATFRAADEDDPDDPKKAFTVRVSYWNIKDALEAPNMPVHVAHAIARGDRHPMLGDAVLQVMAYGRVVWPFDHDVE